MQAKYYMHHIILDGNLLEKRVQSIISAGAPEAPGHASGYAAQWEPGVLPAGSGKGGGQTGNRFFFQLKGDFLIQGRRNFQHCVQGNVLLAALNPADIWLMGTDAVGKPLQGNPQGRFFLFGEK